MKYRFLGKSNLKVSVVSIGTWASSGWMWGKTNRQDAVKAIESAIEHGINLIDTAAIYGFGESEKIVADAIRNHRDKVILATKTGLVWDKAEGEFYFTSDENGRNTKGNIHVYKNLSRRSIRKEIENSLLRLNVDYIDLYQTHRQTTTTPISETMDELLVLKEEGKIREIGVSNVSKEQLVDYQSCGLITSTQEKFSMLDQGYKDNLLPYCQEQNIGFLAYSPLENGLLTGKMTPEKEFAIGDHRSSKELFSSEGIRTVNQMLSEMMPIAEKHNISISQLVISWTFHQPGVTSVIVGARHPNYIHENASAGDVDLSTGDLKSIQKIIQKYSNKIPSN